MQSNSTATCSPSFVRRLNHAENKKDDFHWRQDQWAETGRFPRQSQVESALAELNDLMKKRDEIRNKQLLEAIASSDRSFEEILEFIKKSPPQE